MHTVTACAIGNDFRSELRSQSVIAVAITADASTRHAEFLRQRHAFMTLGTAFGRHCRRCHCRIAFERHSDVVDAVTVRAHGRARNSPSDRLTVNALHEFVGFGAVTLVAILHQQRANL